MVTCNPAVPEANMAKPFEVISRRAFVLGVTSIGITFGLSCCASGAVGDAGVTWDVQRDDGMPQLRQKAADGSVVAACRMAGLPATGTSSCSWAVAQFLVSR